jgi:NAD(P)-dependent dehydrogenase (short-subunit alcohol dehydrogenase family)
MREFRGRAAVITGAASGIGLAIAKLCARHGMRVALLDVRGAEVLAAAEEVATLGGGAIGIETDVASESSVMQAARKVAAEIGKVHLLVNNAAVFTRGGEITSVEDAMWNWLLGVNLYGAIHNLRSFLPVMRSHGEGGHIVMMASISGFTVGNRQNGVYSASKFALVALAEALAHDLEGTGIAVSIALPAAVATQFYENSASLRGDLGGPNLFPTAPQDTVAGMSPDEVAARVLDGVRQNRFYIATHPGTRSLLEERHRLIMAAYDEAERWRASSSDP